MKALLGIFGFVIFAPLAGGILCGLDRIVTARMQGRYGPPVLQSFYDVLKLFKKQNLVVNRFHGYFLFCFLIFLIISGSILYAGDDFLMVVFALTVADMFLVMAAYSTNSPYSFIGAQRELIQMLAAEPMLLITGIGFYLAAGSFDIGHIVSVGKPLIFKMPGIFFGLVYVLTIKIRKSPFDLSTSHHAHQEIVKGLTTEFAGPTLALVEIAHWYETILMLSFVFLFFASQPVVGILLIILIYFIEIIIDNTNARVKWQFTLKSSWIVTLLFGGINLFILYILK